MPRLMGPLPRPAASRRAAARARRAGCVGALVLAGLLAGCATGPALRGDGCDAPVEAAQAIDRGATAAGFAPERASGYTPKPLRRASRFIAVTANPHASRVACRVLRDGGSAVDAAVAAQLVLGVVEPQSSGLGGGGFLLHWDARRRRVDAWDGRETAPAASRADDLRWIDAERRVPPQPSARESGRSVGVPGLVHLLDAAHRAQGRRPWAALFEPAIALAADGFAISPRLARSIAASRDALVRDPLARATFLQPDGSPRTAGQRLVQPALAHTLRTLGEGGAPAFYRGLVAEAIVDAVADARAGTSTPGRMTLADLAAYRSVQRDVLCRPYRRWQVCGMPPPSSGGLAVAQALGVLGTFDLAALAPTSPVDDGGAPDPQGVHLVTEALRLAFADRNRYVADTDFVALPGGDASALLDPGYLRRRAVLVDPGRSLGTAAPGEFADASHGSDAGRPLGGTTHLSIVDRDGNVVVLTSSIEAAFGSTRMTRAGFLLNNQLTDFAAEPLDDRGRPVANRLQPGKRPRSSMSPTLVFEPGADGRPASFAMATGSAGGAAIIGDALRSLVAVLDWGLDAQQAASLVSFGAFNGPATFVGGEHPRIDLREGAADPLVSALRARGHEVRLNAQIGGLAVVVRRCAAWRRCRLEGGADPRREGVALGE